MRVNKKTSLTLAAALTGSLALGGVGVATAAFADDGNDRRAAAQAPAPLPGEQELSRQADTLDRTRTVLAPVTELLQEVLQAENGKLTGEQAERHARAVKEAIAEVRQQAPRAGEQAEQDRQSASARSELGRQDQQDAPADRPAQARADLVAKTTAKLQAQVDALLEAARQGKAEQISQTAKAVVQATVNVVAGMVSDSGLPAPNLPGLPKAGDKAPQSLPEQAPQNLPGQPQLTVPEVQNLPAEAQQKAAQDR